VLAIVGGRYRVYFDGSVIEASIRGRMKQESGEKVLVGDRVVLERHGNDSATIEEVGPRRSLLRRRAPGKNSGVRPVAANVDQVIVVGAARQPDWDPHLVDRFIAVAEASELPAVVVMNKIDLETAAASELDVYRDAGYAVLSTSVPTRTGIAELRSRLRTRHRSSPGRAAWESPAC
jgi:ribosome biogenesis GTPase